MHCQLDVEELLQAQQRLNGRGGEGGSGMGRMISNSIRSSFVNSALDRAVKFVVGHMATPSPEMIQYGLAMRSEPRTQAERDVYLGFMKTVARRTPEVLMKYLKTEVHKNGTKSHSVNFIALDADLTRRALLYQEMREARRREQQKQREQEQQHQMEVARLQALQDIRMNQMFASGVTTGFNLFDNFGQTTPMTDFNALGNFGFQTTTPTVYNVNPVGLSGGNADHQINTAEKTTAGKTSNITGNETVSLLDLNKAGK